ncbi:MAG: anti-sigma factor [Acidobacteria bacterium]|nr:anti-sigma factor [Acidobacteriota bacterium]
MDCRNFHRNLEDYLDGGLDFAERFGMERHAEQCFACGKELVDARELHRLTASLTRVKAPADFEARVRREIAMRKSQGIFFRVRNYLDIGFEWRRFAFTAAACAALAFGIFSTQQIWRDAPAPSVAEKSNSAMEADLNATPEDFKMEELELLLVGPNNYHTLEQLPRKIHVRYGPPSEEYFIRKVSH